MNDSEFEKRLQRQPLRPIPGEWRSEILGAAYKAADTRSSTIVARPGSSLAALNRRLSALLWPSPWAWAGGAASWVLIFALNFAASSGSDAAMSYRSPAPPALVVEMAQDERRQLMTSLLDGAPSEMSTPPREPSRPPPRSELKAAGFRA